MLHPVVIALAILFLLIIGAVLFWMLRSPKAMTPEVARAIFSFQSARCIIVPILDLFYTERAVELACRMGKQQDASIVLAYIVEVPRLVALDSPLTQDIEERANQALKDAQSIVERHDLKTETTILRAREASEGIGQIVQKYGGDIVVLGVQSAERHMPSIFTRTADALLRRPPCEVLIDSMPGYPKARE
jgi:nucleotide-binding universal stress UspA family protein